MQHTLKTFSQNEVWTSRTDLNRSLDKYGIAVDHVAEVQTCGDIEASEEIGTILALSSGPFRPLSWDAAGLIFGFLRD